MRGGHLQEIPSIMSWLENFWYFWKAVAYMQEVVAKGGSTVLLSLLTDNLLTIFIESTAVHIKTKFVSNACSKYRKFVY